MDKKSDGQFEAMKSAVIDFSETYKEASDRKKVDFIHLSRYCFH